MSLFTTLIGCTFIGLERLDLAVSDSATVDIWFPRNGAVNPAKRRACPQSDST
ncbi:MAG: hypothetical protein R3B96_21275 [Pirellulaceae bacterium]